MKINTKTVWDISGDEIVEIHNESYEYTGVVSETKGGGGSCPPPNDTPYTYDPRNDPFRSNQVAQAGIA